LDGQEATLNVSEPRPEVHIEQEVNGKVVEQRQFTGISYLLRVKPRIMADDAKRLVLTIDASRAKPNNAVSPSTSLKSTATVGKTLVIVSSEPYAILISPTSVERLSVVTPVSPAAQAQSLSTRVAAMPQAARPA